MRSTCNPIALNDFVIFCISARPSGVRGRLESSSTTVIRLPASPCLRMRTSILVGGAVLDGVRMDFGEVASLLSTTLSVDEMRLCLFGFLGAVHCYLSKLR